MAVWTVEHGSGQRGGEEEKIEPSREAGQYSHAAPARMQWNSKDTLLYSRHMNLHDLA